PEPHPGEGQPGASCLHRQRLGLRRQGRRPLHELPEGQRAPRHPGPGRELRRARDWRDSMIDPFQAVQALGNPTTETFPTTSRYTGLPIAQLELADGTIVAYLRRRFVPQPERFALLQTHTVTQGERLDNLTATFLGDPEQFWRLCDANSALRPE